MNSTDFVPKLRSISQDILTVCIGIAVAAAVAPRHVVSQSVGASTKFVEHVPVAKHSNPFPLIEFKAQGTVKPTGQSFEAGENWLLGTIFKFRNDSGKEIVYISYSLVFPETRSSGPVMLFAMSLGQAPGIDPQESKAEPFSLAPGQELTVRIDESKYAKVKKSIEKRQPISSINSITFEIPLLVFNDGTGWAGGEYRRQDPNDARRFLPIR
jgi:hypothetical protein